MMEVVTMQDARGGRAVERRRRRVCGPGLRRALCLGLSLGLVLAAVAGGCKKADVRDWPRGAGAPQTEIPPSGSAVATAPPAAGSAEAGSGSSSANDPIGSAGARQGTRPGAHEEGKPAPPPPPPTLPPVEADGVAEIPHFPWPPPATSATVDLTRLLAATRQRFASLGDANNVLRSALSKAGYVSTSYFRVPRGFALVTRLEQIKANGAPQPEPERWVVVPAQMKLSRSGMSFRDYLDTYLRRLLTADPGHYRILAFVVTDTPFTQSQQHITSKEASAWLQQGGVALPRDVATQRWSADMMCVVLVYEFIREQTSDPKQITAARIVVPGSIEGENHLRPRLWAALGLPQ
jgi:hypothetical protein